MRKFYLIFLIFSAIFCTANAQPNYKYQPFSAKEQFELNNTIYNQAVSNFLTSTSLSFGPVTLTDIANMVSFNPIEGVRLRATLQTNNTFSKRLRLGAMLAYGTKDGELKYGGNLAYNFSKKAGGVYSYPLKTLTLSYYHNTFMPSYPNYDVLYYGFGEDSRFLFGRRNELNINYMQDIKKYLVIQPYAQYENIYSYVLFDNGVQQELLAPGKEMNNYSFGAKASYIPSRGKGGNLNIINSRFYSFRTEVSLDYSYNLQDYLTSLEYHKLSLKAQHRILLQPMALDLRLEAGKIFGQSESYMYFTPNYQTSSASNLFGFNLYSPYEMHLKQYLQGFVQLNFGGVLLDHVPFVNSFKPNEFVNFKALVSNENEPYYFEVGAGIDHILGFIGVEVIKRIAKENPYHMPEWAVKLRCTL